MSDIKIHCAYDKLVPISEIKLNPKNRNRHSEDQILRLAEIIKYNGVRRCVTVSNRSGLLVVGHGRIDAMKRLDITHVPVNFQDYETDEAEYADGVADNAISLWAELDLAGINSDLPDLDPSFDLDWLGIKDFVLEPLDKLEPGCDEDEVPEAGPAYVVRGDVFTLGNHRLMCGDSCMVGEVETLMGGAISDMVFTDPPYGISFQSNMRQRSVRFEEIENDDTFLSEWINTLPIVSNGWVFVWTTWKVLGRWIEITAPIGDMTNLIVWDKGGGGIGDLSKTFSTDHEMALVFNRGAEITGKRLGSVWSIGKDRAVEYIHPTQKPVALAETAVENCTNTGDAVLDLFGGSGSTLIACEKTNRQCFMMELDPKYCTVILDRWAKYAGADPIRESDGKLWSAIKAEAMNG